MYCHLADSVTESSKGHSAIKPAAQDDGEHSKNSMIMDPLSDFFCCEVSALSRGNAVWNIMMVGKAFCKSKDSFGRGTA